MANRTLVLFVFLLVTTSWAPTCPGFYPQRELISLSYFDLPPGSNLTVDLYDLNGTLEATNRSFSCNPDSIVFVQCDFNTGEFGLAPMNRELFEWMQTGHPLILRMKITGCNGLCSKEYLVMPINASRNHGCGDYNFRLMKVDDPFYILLLIVVIVTVLILGYKFILKKKIRNTKRD